MKRRDFLRSSAALLVTASAVRSDGMPALWQKLPRWRGFNLLEQFNGTSKPFVESDLQFMHDHGFDFARIPADYRNWTPGSKTPGGDPYKLDEKTLGYFDQLLTWAEKYGIHINLNLHRAPGFTVAEPPEKLSLWTDAEAQKQFAFQWRTFAQRYRAIPSTRLSFNLVNEPPAKLDPLVYRNAMAIGCRAIREVTPDRLIICDGLGWARKPVPELRDLQVAQAGHGYEPFRLTHYEASWVHSKGWPKPQWPLPMDKGKLYDKAELSRDMVEPWRNLATSGVGAHFSEFGSHNHTPHDVVIRWMTDLLDLLKTADIGWALWNLRGSFGVMDSGRGDVAYEDFKGHKLDRNMLEVLKRF
jgi:endoglucanase